MESFTLYLQSGEATGKQSVSREVGSASSSICFSSFIHNISSRKDTCYLLLQSSKSHRRRCITHVTLAAYSYIAVKYTIAILYAPHDDDDVVHDTRASRKVPVTTSLIFSLKDHCLYRLQSTICIMTVIPSDCRLYCIHSAFALASENFPLKLPGSHHKKR